MGFETKVLRAVRKEFSGVETYFYNGTLYVNIVSEDTAEELLSVLRTVVTCDVKLSKIASLDPYVDFAIDFVPFA